MGVKEQPLPLNAGLGVAIVLLSSLLSALAAVYSELLLKSRMDAPIHWQNLQMYIHGTWINLLVMAALLKYLDNIARVYAAAVSMMVVLVASWPLFGVPIAPQVAISIMVVVLSMVQYHLPPSFDRDFDQGVH